MLNVFNLFQTFCGKLSAVPTILVPSDYLILSIQRTEKFTFNHWNDVTLETLFPKVEKCDHANEIDNDDAQTIHASLKA